MNIGKGQMSAVLRLHAAVLIKLYMWLLISAPRLDFICNSVTGYLSTVHGLKLLGKLKPLLNFLLQPGGAGVQLT